MKKFLIGLNIHISSLEMVKKLRRWVSPVFVMMLFASFVLWYIAKLSYTYTTELKVKVDIEKQDVDIRCVVEGVGTNLFGYKIGGSKSAKIPISELRYTIRPVDSLLTIENSSLMGALSVRFSDIKIISINSDAELRMTHELSEALKKIQTKR
ncbi:MAG: hypothetical protein SNG27_02170 [Rikenellaceae bacterium]